MSEQPAAEVAPEGLDLEALVREARARLGAQRDRDEHTGRFLPDNVGALTTGARSEAFWREVNEAKQAIITRVLADLGGPGEAGEIMSGTVEQYAEAKLLRRSLFLDIAAAGGTATAKRHARRLLAPYGQAFDRELKAAQTLGLKSQRHARTVADMTQAEYAAYLEHQRRQQAPEQEHEP